MVKKSAKTIKKIENKKTPPAGNLSVFEGVFPKTKIRVIGIGGGGGSIVSEISKSLKKASFVVADTDIRALKKSSNTQHFYFGQNLTCGLGTGMNPDLAKEAIDKEKEKITKLFKDQDISILIACLGGGVGSGATPVFAEAAQQLKNITLGIFTLPFKFEGERKSKAANDSLKLLKGSLNASITIPNERIFKIINEKTPITEALSIINKSLIKSLESLIDIIYNPGLINIDFADVRTILKGKGKLAFLNTAEAEGKNKTEEILKNILRNPLYSYTNLNVEKILFNISGGKNLLMSDVEKISQGIASLNPRAKIIFGISKNPKYKNKIKTTLLITGEEKKFKKEKAEKKAPTKREPAGKSKEIKKPEIKKKGVEKKSSSKIPVNKEGIIKAPEQPKKEVKKQEVRRTALEIKKAEELEESKKLTEENEFEIPAFLRRAAKK